jgi:hypothetical protein
MTGGRGQPHQQRRALAEHAQGVAGKPGHVAGEFEAFDPDNA